ncbi:hypothetical protein KGF56_000907 [Candida oxycetoniae]|uniref:Uncharacterized protein n=1 Tax=Candida oxycetoniae TaxID=497107 RepID=A0AAI9T071_9ASCO|nr:uncharacterized protein KGF56_000907 [Candida oxycetoniae]KAI3406426.2 hypothetical protein KGF56_000907 [Candida oxycetoniae]
MNEVLSKKVNYLVSLFRNVVKDNIDDTTEYSRTTYDNGILSKYESKIKVIFQLEDTDFHFHFQGEEKAKETKEAGEPGEPGEPKSVKLFNDTVNSRIKEFVVSCGSQTFLTSLVTSFVNSGDNNESDTSRLQDKIAITLDCVIWITLNIDACVKSSFFQSLATISNQLFSISTEQVEQMWSYVESRVPVIISNGMFTNKVGERMQILSFTNSLVDRFEQTKFAGKIDSYKKDTHNDVFQCRVRIFVTQLLDFDDTTGLNKYFHIANRTAFQFPVKDVFLSDIIQVQKIFNDPLYYMKKQNSNELNRLANKLYAILQELLKEELDYSEDTPYPDQFNTTKTTTTTTENDAERKYLCQKFSSRIFVPETYYESKFEIKNRGRVESSQKKDAEFLFKELELSKIRLQYILQIYIVANLYSELTFKAKQSFFVDVNAPSSSRHLTEDTLPPSLGQLFSDMKRETISVLKRIDFALCSLFQKIAIGEKQWWRWLLHGKDQKSGTAYFANNVLDIGELKATEERFKDIFPYKNKKSFNTYVTPQVSRKMRVPRGLEHLSAMKSLDEDAAFKEIEDLTNTALDNTADTDERRSSLSWKVSRKQRTTNWFSYNENLSNQQKTANVNKRKIEEELPEGENKRKIEEEVPEGENKKIKIA